MSYPFLIIALIIAVIDWVAIYLKQRRVEWMCKPAIMLALLAFLAANGGFKGHPLWFVAGLVFSLAGDVLLILPKEQFIAGLIAFLIAHLFYLVGFNLPKPVFNAPVLILAVAVALTSFQVYQSIAKGLLVSGKAKLRTPVLIYSTVISLMLLSALSTLTGESKAGVVSWAPVTALFVSVGALLFFISDAILALNKFVKPTLNGRLVYMICYHLGQTLITVGVALQFLS
jgi:uncharacterized membrane protein YhhN